MLTGKAKEDYENYFDKGFYYSKNTASKIDFFDSRGIYIDAQPMHWVGVNEFKAVVITDEQMTIGRFASREESYIECIRYCNDLYNNNDYYHDN